MVWNWKTITKENYKIYSYVEIKQHISKQSVG